MKSKKKIVWFARGGGIKQCGPFETQVDATNAMRLIEETDSDYARYFACCRDPLDARPQLKGGFPADIFVWPEEVNASP